jgi:hypothetical protein
MKHDEARYAQTTANTHVVQPWAFFMFLYQLPVWFPGWVFFAVVVAGLVLLIARWRRGWGKYAGLAWTVAMVNLVVPIAAHELDYRYALSAVPFACLALGLTLAPKRGQGAVASGAVASGGGAAGAVAAGDGVAGDGTPPAAAEAGTEEVPAEADEG